MTRERIHHWLCFIGLLYAIAAGLFLGIKCRNDPTGGWCLYETVRGHDCNK